MKYFLFNLFLSLSVYQAFATGEITKDNRAIAFPGAEGAGKYTTGGRGGIVYKVTNLNDDGPGSLRDGIQKKGARIIVFSVSGVIELQSSLDINNDNITIAGQSAPGLGITLVNYGMKVGANNVIVRYLRIRPGDKAGIELDALKGKEQKDIIIDHCSVSWATDEVCSFYDNENFTLQYCIISESLNESVHHKGSHGYGGIWGGMNSSFHHNLLAHHKSRNPRINGSRYHKQPEREKAEFVNNVVYNWKSKCMYAGEDGNYKIAGNFFFPGPATSKSASKQFLEPYKPYSNYNITNNYLEGFPEVTQDNLKGIEIEVGSIDSIELKATIEISDYKIESPVSAFTKVLNSAGASKQRDEIDTRIIGEVKNKKSTYGENGIINSQTEVGGYPSIISEKADVDTDKDGMPDVWEQNQKGLNDKLNDANGYDLSDTFTNVEVYLNSLVSF
nr:pectate lyase [uncultured Carboxylicivirga sp.]